MKIFWNRFYTNGGWFTWVAAGIAVAGAVAGGVQAHNQAKDAAGQAEAQRKAGLHNQLPEFAPPAPPGYTPFNFNGVNKDAIAADRMAYARSDRDFATRHAPIIEAEKLFEAGVLKDQKGEHELLPAIQAELTRAGIGGALDAFGDTGSVLEPGSAGEASVARNLGLGIMGFQDRNRRDRERSLSIAEEVFPRREFGMNGEDYASTALSDAVNRNAFAASNYAAEAGTYEKNYEIDAANKNAAITSNNDLAAAKAAADAERTKALMGAATSAAGAAATGYGKSRAGANYGVRPKTAKYPGSTAWVPVGTYAGG